jgi:hypothetical protein
MRTPSLKNSVLSAFSCLVILASQTVANTPPALPNPVLVFVGAEYVEVGGKQLTRYYFDVFNKEAYPAELFAAAPGLPPCGSNTNSSRTWVDIFTYSGKRLNGFCALGNTKNMDRLWFALDSTEVPPSWIYIEMTDRQTNTKYKSNLAETTL